MAMAITFSQYGPPSVLTASQIEVPEPGPGQVRIRSRAVGVNPIDTRIRKGIMQGVFPVEFPMILGWDVAGEVEAAGDGATAAVGDEVFGLAATGGYAQHALLDRPVARPPAASWETAAALVTPGEAAFRVLKHLAVEPGETLLIHGAAGTVGAIAVQLAAARGVKVVGTAAPGDQESVSSLGATAVPYGDGWVERVRAAAPQGVDAVFDASGAGVLADSVQLVGGAERILTIADPTAAEHGVRFTGSDPTDRAPEALPLLADLAASGDLEVPIWCTYPLAAAAQAHEDIELRRCRGKIVLLP